MAMEEVTASRGVSHIRDSRSSVMDRQRREKGTNSQDVTERARAARRRPSFSYYPQPEHVEPDQAHNRGPGLGW
jgi:hypothetical protein